MVEKMSMVLDLEILLNFLNVGREPESFIIFIHFLLPFLVILFLLYIYIYIYIYSSLFSLFFFFFYYP
jgi:hypothetical protein